MNKKIMLLALATIVPVLTVKCENVPTYVLWDIHGVIFKNDPMHKKVGNGISVCYQNGCFGFKKTLSNLKIGGKFIGKLFTKKSGESLGETFASLARENGDETLADVSIGVANNLTPMPGMLDLLKELTVAGYRNYIGSA